MATKCEWHKVCWMLMDRALSRSLILIISGTTHSIPTLKPLPELDMWEGSQNFRFMSFTPHEPWIPQADTNTYHFIHVFTQKKGD